MKLFNKCTKAAEKTKDKLVRLITALETEKNEEKILSKVLEGEYINYSVGGYYTDEIYKDLHKYNCKRYFTNKEKDIIIDYLMECLIDSLPFICSTLGPTKYKQEN